MPLFKPDGSPEKGTVTVAMVFRPEFINRSRAATSTFSAMPGRALTGVGGVGKAGVKGVAGVGKFAGKVRSNFISSCMSSSKRALLNFNENTFPGSRQSGVPYWPRRPWTQEQCCHGQWISGRQLDAGRSGWRRRHPSRHGVEPHFGHWRQSACHCASKWQASRALSRSIQGWVLLHCVCDPLLMDLTRAVDSPDGLPRL